MLKIDAADAIAKELAALAKDEEEAIEGYEKALRLDMPEKMREQMQKILLEEKTHLAYLKEASEDPDAEYRDPLSDDAEVQAEAFEPDWME